MKKYLICFLVLLSSLSVRAQYPISQGFGNANTKVTIPPNGAISGIIIINNFTDTTAANTLCPCAGVNGSIIRTSDSLWIRFNSGWTLVGTGGGGGGSGFTGVLLNADSTRYVFYNSTTPVDSVVTLLQTVIGLNGVTITQSNDTLFFSTNSALGMASRLISGSVSLTDSTVTLTNIKVVCAGSNDTITVSTFSRVIPAVASGYKRSTLFYYNCEDVTIDTLRGTLDTLFGVNPVLPNATSIPLTYVQQTGDTRVTPNIVSNYQRSAIVFINDSTGQFDTDSANLNYNKTTRAVTASGTIYSLVSGGVAFQPLGGSAIRPPNNVGSGILYLDGADHATNSYVYLRTGSGLGNRFILFPSGNAALSNISNVDVAALKLNVESVTSAFAPPRMNGVQQNAIGSPVAGSILYNTDSLALCYYNGSAWRKLAAGSGSGTNTLQQTWALDSTASPNIDVRENSFIVRAGRPPSGRNELIIGGGDGAQLSSISETGNNQTSSLQATTEGGVQIYSLGTNKASYLTMDSNIVSLHGAPTVTDVNVGIGTTTPSATAHISNSVDSNILKLSGTFSNTSVGTDSALIISTDGLVKKAALSSGSGVTSVGTIQGVGTTNGASISGTTLRLAKVTSTTGGVLTSGADSILGTKTWLSSQIFNNASDGVTINAVASNDGAIKLNRTTSITNHGIVDQGVIGGTNTAYALLDHNSTTSGNKDHIITTQSRFTVSSGDTLNSAYAASSLPTVNGYVRYRNGYQFRVPGGSGGVGSNYAFSTGAITAAQADSNFATYFLGGRGLYAQAVVASANYGTLSIGSGAFDGSTSGFFTGSASGTVLAVNAPSGFAGSLVNFQTAGVDRFWVSGSGSVSIGGTIANSTSRLNIHHPTTSTASSVRFSNGSISAANGLDVGLTASNTAQIMYIGGAALALGTNNTARLTFGGSSTATFATNVVLRTGTATAGTYPMKFVTGSAALLTVPVEGVMEVLADSLYYTGSGAARRQVTQSLYNSATLDFGNTAAQSSADLTITVTGASAGDVVAIGVPNGSTLTNSSFTAWVSATDTVTIRFNNYSSGSQDPASGSFKVRVIK